MHAALANFNMITDPNYKTEAVLHQLLRKNWVREGFANIDEEKSYGIKGLNMLSNYVDNRLDKEKETIIIEQMIKKDINEEFTLCGKIDKAYINETGAFEVIDYKTGERIEHSDEFTYDIQLPLYTMLVKEKTGEYPDIISYYYLSQNRKIIREITPERINIIDEYLSLLINSIKKDKDYLPNPNGHCEDSCEFFNICSNSIDFNSFVINDLVNNRENGVITAVF
jgi:CRISPR/Cas system-associated exonuclease Cas4 (RecB family)